MPIKQPIKRRPVVPKRPSSTSSKKPITKPTETVVVTETAPKAELLNRVARRPVVPRRPVLPPKAEPKEVSQDVTQTKPKPQAVKPRTPGKSTQASKPAPTTGRQSEPARPRPASGRNEESTQEVRVSVEMMRRMTLEERYDLFKSLNTSSEFFNPIRKELPKQLQMRKAEAILRDIIPKVPPVKTLRKNSASLPVHYCPYCVDWQPFSYHAWVGYMKCIGCSISTRDFYVSADNSLFGKD